MKRVKPEIFLNRKFESLLIDWKANSRRLPGFAITSCVLLKVLYKLSESLHEKVIPAPQSIVVRITALRVCEHGYSFPELREIG